MFVSQLPTLVRDKLLNSPPPSNSPPPGLLRFLVGNPYDKLSFVTVTGWPRGVIAYIGHIHIRQIDRVYLCWSYMWISLFIPKANPLSTIRRRVSKRNITCWIVTHY